MSGIDLIDGTPIIDIKPYIPDVDRPCMSTIQIPEWMKIAPKTSLTVVFTSHANQYLKDMFQNHKKKHDEKILDHFDDFESTHNAITEALQLDPRSIHSRKKHTNAIYAIQLDRLDVHFRIKKHSTDIDITNTLSNVANSANTIADIAADTYSKRTITTSIHTIATDTTDTTPQKKYGY